METNKLFLKSLIYTKRISYVANRHNEHDTSKEDLNFLIECIFYRNVLQTDGNISVVETNTFIFFYKNKDCFMEMVLLSLP